MIVKYQGYQSHEVEVCSGVPQGSVLGPLFFVIFINDIIVNIKSNILIYADDIKIFKTISSMEDCLILQNDLTTFLHWSNSNLLPVNFDKSYVMSYTNKNFQILYNYTLNNIFLSRVDTFKDLGVIFDSKLTFHNHINAVTSEAFKSLGFIIRCGYHLTDINCLRILYFAYVRSKLEYASVVWSPFQKTYIDSLEKIQRRFLKYLMFRADGNYPPRGFPHVSLLQIFHIDDLNTRRVKAALNFLKKLIAFDIDCSYLLSKICFYVPRLSSRNRFYFYLPTPRINIVKHSPIYEMCSLYNQNLYDLELFR